jgi:hypothetical protein
MRLRLWRGLFSKNSGVSGFNGVLLCLKLRQFGLVAFDRGQMFRVLGLPLVRVVHHLQGGNGVKPPKSGRLKGVWLRVGHAQT